MRDRVAEVLEERESRGASLGSGAVVSLLLHAALAAPLFFIVTGEPGDRPEPVRVRLQQSGVPSPVTVPESVPAPLPSVPAEVEPEIEPLPELPKPETTTVDESLFGRSPEEPEEKREEEPRAVPGKEEERPATPPSAPGNQISVAGGSASVASFDGVEFPFPLYVDRMLSLIARRWFRPQAAPGNPVTIHFVVDRDGKVRDVEVRSSSGSSSFDRAARRAVIEASPLPPLPFEYLGTDLGVHLQFN